MKFEEKADVVFGAELGLHIHLPSGEFHEIPLTDDISSSQKPDQIPRVVDRHADRLHGLEELL